MRRSWSSVIALLKFWCVHFTRCFWCLLCFPVSFQRYISKCKRHSMWEICTTHILPLFCVKRVPTLYISGFHPPVLLYHRWAWPTFHVPQSLTVTAIMVRNFTSPQHIWKISAPPILPSCELYSFLVLYILFFCFCFFVVFGWKWYWWWWYWTRRRGCFEVYYSINSVWIGLL